MPQGVFRTWKQAGAAFAFLLLAFGSTGCHRIIFGPDNMDEGQTRPDKVVDFNQLYTKNCQGCHGVEGKGGPAINLNNPLYWAIASDDDVRSYTATGKAGMMPAFATSAGGLLTDEQVDVLVKGMRQRWAQPSAVAGLTLPGYAAKGPGDVSHGAQVYTQACARCHGDAGAAAHAGKAGSVTDPTYLSLISDQGLRTILIAGRPDLGHPDYRNDIPGHPLTDTEITDVVAWLSSRRTPLPGNPHPAAPQSTELQRRTAE